MAKKLALGKGIASLLHDATPATVVNQTYNSHYGSNDQQKNSDAPVENNIEIRYENTPLMVDVGSIKTNPNQPRKIVKEKDHHYFCRIRLFFFKNCIDVCVYGPHEI